MRKIIFILIPVEMLLSGFKKIVADIVEKPHKILSLSSSIEERLQERVKIIKQFVNTNSKNNKELAFFIDLSLHKSHSFS